jgi:hypothetical protein
MGFRPSSPRSPANKASLPTVNGYGALRSVLEHACTKTGYGLGELTVLSTQVDPYRLDTPSGHRDGAWLAKQLNRLVKRGKKIHWRGLHYVIVVKGNIRKPNGEVFRNDDDDWVWLSSVAGKAARWLGYVPFERITDNRNAEPIIHRKARVVPEAYVSIGLDVTVPDANDLEPMAIAEGFEPRQAYQFVIFGEKASLEDVVLPVAHAKQADMYLNTGEISDTRLYEIARDAATDGRPLVVFTLTDCDPAGYQMSVSIGRKLQALRDLFFPKLQFEVVPVALTVEQVREFGLPSTPLKETEKRADRWREAFGVEQTEIDALATLQPVLLRQILERAFEPYWDDGLEDRVEQAKKEWEQAADKAIHEQIDQEKLDALRKEAAEKLTELQDSINNINERLRLAAVDHFTLPVIEVPEVDVDDGAPRLALVNFEDSWVTATRALIARKQYGKGVS